MQFTNLNEIFSSVSTDWKLVSQMEFMCGDLREKFSEHFMVIRTSLLYKMSLKNSMRFLSPFHIAAATAN